MLKVLVSIDIILKALLNNALLTIDVTLLKALLNILTSYLHVKHLSLGK